MKFGLLTIFGFLLVAHAVFMAPACTNDELPPPATPDYCDTLVATYITNVKPIIDESCAYSGCHDGTGAGSNAPGNYRSYNGVLSDVESGLFRSRVLGTTDPVLGMPPNQSVYDESVKDDLTVEELQMIECWLLAGAPEQ